MLTERWCVCFMMRASSSNQQRKSASGRVVLSLNVNKDDGRVRVVFMKAVGNENGKGGTRSSMYPLFQQWFVFEP